MTYWKILCSVLTNTGLGALTLMFEVVLIYFLVISCSINDLTSEPLRFSPFKNRSFLGLRLYICGWLD
jgi:hypothetical protein